ncbi:DUF3455 domain-containing protein [Dyella sp. C9]|uniref:DUF3455 domain-containing protein n=1 Tax=Dyella sp. C9 TaxID=2202154 RepID=UPI0013001849|nr:DUF3455 domain-containing protein [Dyella sp. C9]
MRMRRMLVTMATALLLLAGSMGLAQADESVPPALAPPAGYTAVLTARATGVQIYRSTADGAGFKWSLEAPLAELSYAGGVIHHYAGPSWEAADGSKLARDASVPVASVPAAHASADIPWLLLKVTADPAPGALAKVGFVQRIATQGGVAPAQPPVRAGTLVGVPYTATYVFYARPD